MADERQAYTSRTWQTGDVITKQALNNIENEMGYVSAEINNAVTGTINNDKINDTIARKLDSIVKYFPDTDTLDPATDLEYVRMYAQPSTEDAIVVPKEEEYLRFKQNFVQPFTNKAYVAGNYVEYEDEIYKVTAAIAKNNSAADDAAAWEAILALNPSPIRKINVMQEVDNLINVYTNDSQLTSEQNRIWIQQTSETVQAPSMQDFINFEGSMVPAYSASKNYEVGDYIYLPTGMASNTTSDYKIYKCTTSCNAAAWTTNSTNFTTAQVASDLKGEISQLKSATINTEYGFELFDKNKRTQKYRLRPGGDYQSNNATFVSDFINVIPGESYVVSPTLLSSNLGGCWYTAKDMTARVGGFASNTSPLIVTAPATAKYMRVTGMTGQEDIFSVKRIIKNEKTYNLQTVRHGSKFRTLLNPNGIDGYPYCAFSSGVIYNGKEVHATRIGPEHYTKTTGSADWGKIVFHEIDSAGNITVRYPDIDWANQGGELRDPNLSLSRDGQYLFLSAFLSDGTSVVGGKLYMLDENYHVTSSCDMSTSTAEVIYAIWGNVLETPSGYLLKTEYRTNGKYLALIRSSTKFTGTVNEMTFGGTGNVVALDTSSSTTKPTECSICYHKDKLVAIWRSDSRNGSTPVTKISVTSDLEGMTGWSTPVEWDEVIHCPALAQYNDDDVLVLMGALKLAGQDRLPFIGLVDTDQKDLLIAKQFDLTCDAGGYPSIVRLDSTRYSTVYYDHTGETSTKLYHRGIDLRFMPGFMAFLDPGTQEVYPVTT